MVYYFYISKFLNLFRIPILDFININGFFCLTENINGILFLHIKILKFISDFNPRFHKYKWYFLFDR